MAAAVIVEELEIRRALRRERIFRDRTKVLDTVNDRDLISRYRLPRDALFTLLDTVSAHLETETRRSHAIPPETKLLMTLRFLSKGGFYSEIGDIVGVSRSSVSRMLHSCVEVLCHHLPEVTFPDDLASIKHDYYKMANFPCVIGAIDGTLVPIQRPAAHEEAVFVSRKGYHAINVQAICDSKLRFINVVAKWPGSCHDSGILANSAIGRKFSENKPDGVLLGDSGYPCRPWLLTPILEPANRAEEKYNNSHIKTRNCIERAFGVLKSRFRCLHKSTGCLPFTPSKCCKVILACVKLHNFCLSLRLPAPQPLEDEPDHQEHTVHTHQGDGNAMRKRVIQNFFTQEEQGR